MPTVNYTLHARRSFQTGVVASAAVDVPAAEGTLSAVLDATNMTGANQSCVLTIETSNDNGASWIPWATLEATSEPRTTKGDPSKPSLTLPFKFDAPLKARCVFDVRNGPFTVGVSGSVIYT